MSGDGKKVLLSIIAVPVLAALGSFLIFSAEEESIGQTVAFVFGTNLIPMLIAGFFSGILVRAVNKSSGAAANKRWVALAPIGLTLAFGIIWYLLALVNIGGFDAGRQYFSGPLYLLMLALGAGVLASIAYLVIPKATSQ